MSVANSRPAKIAEMHLRDASVDEIHDTPHVSFSTIATVKRTIEANAPRPVVKSPGRTTKVSSSVLMRTRAQMMANPWLSARALSCDIVNNSQELRQFRNCSKIGGSLSRGASPSSRPPDPTTEIIKVTNE
jgi:hypothetical protein